MIRMILAIIAALFVSGCGSSDLGAAHISINEPEFNRQEVFHLGSKKFDGYVYNSITTRGGVTYLFASIGNRYDCSGGKGGLRLLLDDSIAVFAVTSTKWERLTETDLRKLIAKDERLFSAMRVAKAKKEKMMVKLAGLYTVEKGCLRVE